MSEKPQAAPVGPVLWRGERLAPFALRERRLVAQNESIEASPLETKRRNRARPVDLSRGASIPSDTVRSSGALKVEQLKTASRQLAANARRPELGPGAARLRFGRRVSEVRGRSGRVLEASP